MTFSIFLLRLNGSEAADADAEQLMQALRPYLSTDTRFPELRAGTARATIYGLEDLATGFMVSHVTGGAILELLIGIAASCDLVIAPVGTGLAITSEAQRAVLPDGLRENAVVVTSGAALHALLEAG